MLGAFVLFAITWGLLHFHGQGLVAIGLDQPRQRAVEFAAGFAIFGLLPMMRNLAWAPVADFSWVATEAYSLQDLAQTFRFLTQAVIFEELFFRGYPLWLAMRYLGRNRGVVLSAVAFGIYHWFSYGILGAWQPMVWVFLLTGAAGLLFAFAYARTGSILMPIGLHMGHNTVSVIIFSDGPWGVQWLIPSQPPIDSGFAVKLIIDMIWPLAFIGLAIWALSHFYRKADSGIDQM